MPFKTDKRLWLNADKSRIVEDGDPDAAFLAYGPGQMVSDEDIERYGLEAPAEVEAEAESGGDEGDAATKAEAKPRATKAQTKPAAKK